MFSSKDKQLKIYGALGHQCFWILLLFAVLIERYDCLSTVEVIGTVFEKDANMSL
jgi:hypothetical protein